MVTIPVVAVADGASLPTYAHDDDAGCDLVAAHRAELPARGGRAVVGCGFALAIPEPRSGLAANHGITCLNAPGLIDAGYRGEVRVVLLNTDPDTDYVVESGDRIAQLVVQRVEHVTFRSGSDLEPSTRGAGGFGSTGTS
jgi:dUTP pyrophosphatase